MPGLVCCGLDISPRHHLTKPTKRGGLYLVISDADESQKTKLHTRVGQLVVDYETSDVHILRLTYLRRLKTLWIMTPATQMMKYPQWEDVHYSVAVQGSESLLLPTENLVCLESYSYVTVGAFNFSDVWISPVLVFDVFSLIIVLWSRFGLQDSCQVHHASSAHTVRSQRNFSPERHIQKHLLTHCTFPHTQQRE